MNAVRKIAPKYPEEDALVALIPAFEAALNKLIQPDIKVNAFYITEHFDPKTNVSGSIDMISNNYNGYLRVHLDKKVVFSSMACLTGEAPGEINTDVLDFACEFANTTYGILKSVFNGSGLKFEMAFPTSNFTDKFHNGISKDARFIVPFQANDTQNYIEIFLAKKL